MKKLVTIFSILIVSFTTYATSKTVNDISYHGERNNRSYIFVEGNVEFSIFPDGQFDFVYIGSQNASGVSVNTSNVSISFNSGYDYDMYVQYDDYGAIIQIENIPIYYDEFGRIIQAGSVEIRYNNRLRRVVQVGGLFVHYNSFGLFSYTTGFINGWNRFYVYRPWHAYYAPPIFANCIVYDFPYRRYYTPVRYSFLYHRNNYRRGHNYYRNGRRSFYRPGSRVHYRDGRTAVNRDYNPRIGFTSIARSGKGNFARGGNNTINRIKPDNNATRGNPTSVNRRDKGNLARGGNSTVNRGKPGNNVTRGNPTSVNRGEKGNFTRGGISTINRGNKVKKSRGNYSTSRGNTSSRKTYGNANRKNIYSSIGSAKSKKYTSTRRSNNGSVSRNYGYKSSRKGNGSSKVRKTVSRRGRF